MRILAIDPGTTESAWLLLEDGIPGSRGIAANDGVLGVIKAMVGHGWVDVVVIEQFRSYGMPVGIEVMDAIRWAGRFEEAVQPTPVRLLPRLVVKTNLCHSAKATDANVRAALLDRFGGRSAALGTAKAPGPLRGITKDVWSALALAVTYADTTPLREERE